jgi:ankyrin repeat protein
VSAVLLDHGADYSIRDQQGETPLALARRYDRNAIVNLLEDHGAVE